MLSWLSGGSRDTFADADKYSLVRLQRIFETLTANEHLPRGSEELMVESIRAVAEILVYGDQHVDHLFDYFCEKNVLNLFLNLLEEPNCTPAIKIQIIQTVSIIAQNLRSETSLYYVLSNNHVNRLISHPFDFEDEELLAYYISFLKTLSLKLNAKTIQFFFNDKLQTLPLYEEAVKLLNHPEGMVRTAVRAITLNIFRVDDPLMRRFVAQSHCNFYFEDVVREICIRCRILHLNILRFSHVMSGLAVADQVQLTRSVLLKLEVGLTEQQDSFLYLEDILQLKDIEIDRVVASSAMAYLFLPLIVTSLLPNSQVYSTIHEEAVVKEVKSMGMTVAAVEALDSSSSGALLSLFLLSQAITALSNTSLLKDLISAIVGKTKSPVQDQSAVNGNAIRQSFFALLEGKDERHLLGCVCVLYSILNNPAIDHELLKQCDLLSARQMRNYCVTHNTKTTVEQTTEAEETSQNEDGDSSRLPQQDKLEFCYPFETVKTLLQALCRSVPCRTITQRAIAKLVIALTYDDEGPKPCLREQDLELLKQAYRTSVDRVLAHMEVIRADLFLETFQYVWEKLHKGPLEIGDMFNMPALLLPPRLLNVTDKEKWNLLQDLVPLEAREAMTPREDAICAIKSCMILRLLRCTIYQERNSMLSGLCKLNLEASEEQWIDVSKCEYMKVRVLGASNDTSMKDAYLVLIDNTFVLAEADKTGGVARCVAPLERMNVGIDHLDPRQLHLCIRSPSPIGWARKESKLPAAVFKISGSPAPEHPSSLPFKSWYITLMFYDHASSNWAREDLEKAILVNRKRRIETIKQTLLSKPCTVDTLT